ncbi:MAG: hypothetical protein LBG80_07780, partial [Bacteroidales bacterium]|nr:hypothetical protein [Bacteroidales bacterium]
MKSTLPKTDIPKDVWETVSTFSEATDEVAEVKVKVINEDNIRVVIDRSAGENAGQVTHGWPPGVSNALIVITAADGKTEVYRQMTTRLHNDVR